MKTSFPVSLEVRQGLSLGILYGFLMLGAGCKQLHSTLEQPSQAGVATPAASQAMPSTDRQTAGNSQAQIQDQIQAKIAAESALRGQNIRVSVSDGVATLSGSVINDASRSLAAADSGSVEGVRTVINNLTVAPPPRTAEVSRPRRQPAVRRPPPPPRQTQAAAPVPLPPPPPQPEQVKTIAPPPPPPPPPPVARTVTLAAGTVIPVRMTDTLDSATTQPDSVFHGSLAADLIVDGMVAAPRGAAVVGRVITAKNATHFSGSSELSIELTKIDAHNQGISLVTDAYTKKGAGRGKNTAMKSGGGAALGAIIGALAGGGKGAAIGAVTGGGVGAGVNGVKRGQQVQIPTETLVNFRLQSPVTVTTSRKAGGARGGYSNAQGPQLQQPQQ